MFRKNVGESSKKIGCNRKSEDILKVSPSTPTSPNSQHVRRLTEFQSTPDCFTVVAIDSPLMKSKANVGSMELINGNNHLDGKEDSSMITVGVRVRPFTQRELVEDTKCIISMSGNETVVKPEKGDICRFTYDYSFWSFDESSNNYADQTHVYEALAHPLLLKVLQGYNACLFAYGQTGSGKSYSIMGHGRDVGVVPRFCEELFQKIRDNMAHDCNVTFNVELSFFEIYNEKIHDLLGSSCGKDKSCKKPSLRVREHPVMGPFVDGLSSYVVKSFDDVATWLIVGSKRRATASTCMNDSSSRSHSVFTLMITQTKTSVIDESVHKHNIISKINLVDLAGSERQSTAKTTGDRLREGASINKSLMALGKVISILSEQSSVYGRNRKNFIPYRETILTWLLKESLGGNSKTSMLATISPSSLNLEETLSTLRYARQARNIINTARINEDQNARIIRNLQAEIEKLKMMAGGSGFGEEKCLTEIKLLKDELLKKEAEMAEITRSWQEKLKQSEACKQEEARLLEKFGVSSNVDPDRPCLMNLNEDPQLSEVLFYAIKEGTTRVGRMRDDCNLDVQLDGALIADEHCTFNLYKGAASITPVNNSACYVNGHEVPAGSTVAIHNGDRIVLAGDHFFRFINPLEEKINGAVAVHSLLPKDFYFAYQEFTTMQNARLEAELTKVKVQHTEEMKMMEAEKQKQKDDMQEQLSANRQRTSSLQADYESRLNKLKDMLSEHKEAEMHNQVKKLEKEKEALERQLQLLKLSQEEKHDVLSRNYNSNLLEFIDTMEKDLRDFMNNGQSSDILDKCDESNKLLLMLKEANNISSLLHKDLKFTREHLGNSELVVKVQRVRMNLSTYWSINRFKAKLQDMKDLYQGRIESCKADEILFDPKDVWECSSQSDVASSFAAQNIPQSSTLQSIVSTSFFECSLDSLDLSLSDSRLVSKPSKCYSQMIQASLQEFKELTVTDSTADRVLYAGNKIYVIVEDLHSYNQNSSKVLEDHQRDNSLMYLVHSFNSLQSLVSQWLLQLSSSHSEVITTSKDLLFDVISDLGYHIQMFIQGLENNVSSLVTEFHPKIKSNLLTISSVSGKLSLSCQLDCFSLKNIQLVDSENKYTSRAVNLILKKSFLTGCNEFVMQALLAANNVLVESKHRLMELSRTRNSEICEPSKELLKRTYRTVSSTTLLLKKLEALQLQLTNPAEDQNDVGDHILASFQTCKSLCLQFSSIVDCALQLIDMIEWIISGGSTSASMSSMKLILDNLNMHLCGLMDNTCIGSNQSFRLENSQLSDFLNSSQMEMLEDAVEEVKEAVNDLSCLTSEI